MTTKQHQRELEIHNRLLDIQHRMDWVAQDPETNLSALSQAAADFEKLCADNNKLCADIAVAYYNAKPMTLARKTIRQSKLQTSPEILAAVKQIDKICTDISSKLFKSLIGSSSKTEGF